jgi:hypothetical protein
MNRWQQQFDFLKRAPFVFYLSLLPAFAIACSCHTKKVQSATATFFSFFFYTEMNDRKKYVCGKKRERENETNFFFLFASEVLNSTFFHRAQVKKEKKWKEGKSRVQQKEHHSLSLAIVCSSFSLSFFFFSVYMRAFGVCKYINARQG